MIKVEEIL